jgi:hypothetical protein
MPDAPDIAGFCRQIETYLCQKNEGHLIRVVGPSFDLVAGWARQGVPIKVAFRGIDRTVERYYRQGPRRRPVRIDFCDADVLDVFDEWRRATGVTGVATRGEDESAASEPRPHPEHAGRRGPSLPEHLQRALMRLTDARTAGTLPDAADPLIDAVARELDEARRSPRGLRGEARAALLARLQSVDGSLMELARSLISPEDLAGVEREAEHELSAFRRQMDAEAFARARRAAVDTALRQRLRLPTLTAI